MARAHSRAPWATHWGETGAGRAQRRPRAAERRPPRGHPAWNHTHAGGEPPGAGGRGHVGAASHTHRGSCSKSSVALISTPRHSRDKPTQSRRPQARFPHSAGPPGLAGPPAARTRGRCAPCRTEPPRTLHPLGPRRGSCPEVNWRAGFPRGPKAPRATSCINGCLLWEAHQPASWCSRTTSLQTGQEAQEQQHSYDLLIQTGPLLPPGAPLGHTLARGVWRQEKGPAENQTRVHRPVPYP